MGDIPLGNWSSIGRRKQSMRFHSHRSHRSVAGKLIVAAAGVALLMVSFTLWAQSTINVTTTVHDVSVDGSVALNTVSDLYQGGGSHSATYNTIACPGKGNCT